jgi:hypothetical protein
MLTRVGVSAALEGRCLQRPRSRKRLPSKDFQADDDQKKILAKLRDLGCQQYKDHKDSILDRSVLNLHPLNYNPPRRQQMLLSLT